MNYLEALRAAKAGEWIKREVWDTYLRFVGNRLHFQLSPKLAEELGTEFEPHPTDLKAKDWVTE